MKSFRHIKSFSRKAAPVLVAYFFCVMQNVSHTPNDGAVKAGEARMSGSIRTDTSLMTWK